MLPVMAELEASLLIIQAGITILALLVILALPDVDAKLFEGLVNRLRPWARHPRIALLLIGIAAPAVRLAVLPIAPIPEPAVHDEFSHLLAADTFASGRLANPPHPLWQHFETFYVDQHPTYMSMYFPGHGMVLALGKVLFGHPWFGVCLSMGVMCAAIYWMLLGWFAPEWALLGGVLTVLHLGICSYWMNSYWGGSVSATAGALVLGALPRLMENPRLRTSIALGAGVAALGVTRPYEGTFLSLPVAAALLVWMYRKREHVGPILRRVVLPVGMILALTLAALAAYDRRVFGSPWILPYQHNRATYAVSPYFLWQTPHPEPAYRHKVMRDFYVNWEYAAFRKARTPIGFLGATANKFGILVFFYWGSALIGPVLMFRRVIADPRYRFLVLTTGFFVAGLLLNAFLIPHYAAPGTALFIAFLVIGLEKLWSWRPSGRLYVILLPVFCLLIDVVHLAFIPVDSPAGMERAQVAANLARLPGPQLAIVRYSPSHSVRAVEWVYNAADIDGSKVVWAREMNPASDQELLDYYKGRQAWLIEPDFTPPRVSPYTAPHRPAD
jgi:hypothetical protein